MINNRGKTGEIVSLLNQAYTQYQNNQLAEAEITVKRVLRTDPNHPGACYQAGLIAKKCGQIDLACNLISNAIKNNPRESTYYFELALTLHEGGNLAQAVAAQEQAIKIKPRFVDAHHHLGVLLEALGHLELALASYERAIKIKPQHAPLHTSRAFILWKLGHKEESLLACDRVTRLKPKHAAGHYNRGNALSGMGRLEEAAAAYEKSIHLKPDYAEAYSNLGMVLKDMCRLEEAETIYRQALKLKPNDTISHSNLLFLLLARCKLPPSQLLEEQNNWDKVHGQDGRQNTLPARSTDPETDPERRIRIGYVSSDLRTHAVSNFFEPIISNHDRNHFDIFCYATHEEHLSDTTTERLRGISEHWQFVANYNDQQLAQLIYNDNIDILIDLSGHTGGNRLKAFTYRPAPVQATYMGFFASTGLEAMDYWITDEVIHPPDTLEQTVENIYRLPRCSLCYQPASNTPPVSQRPNEDNQVVFGSFSDISKLTPEVIETWSQILHNLPESRLLLTTKALKEPKNQQLLINRFAKYSIPAERLTMESTLSNEEWLNTYSRVDIVLDPFPRTGTTTTAEALWMGVPVVTLAGQRYVERASATELTAVGLKDLIADSYDDYITKATAIAKDHIRRSELRANLRQQMAESPLCNSKELTVAMETAYKTMWKIFLSKTT